MKKAATAFLVILSVLSVILLLKRATDKMPEDETFKYDWQDEAESPPLTNYVYIKRNDALRYLN